MARSKETIIQRSFGFGEIRPEAEERDDLAIIEESVFSAQNTITLTTGQIEGRPGLLFENATTASRGYDIDLGGGRVYDLHLRSTGYILFDTSGAVVSSRETFIWTDKVSYGGAVSFSDIAFWVLPIPDLSSILIGSSLFPLQVLKVNSAGTWTIGEAAYSEDASGAPLVPFFNPMPGTKISIERGAGRAVVVKSGDPMFEAAHVGTVIRSNGVPILLEAFVNSQEMSGTAYRSTPQTVRITVTNADAFSEGDVVEHKNLGGTGLVTTVNYVDNRLTVFALGSSADFDATGILIGPDARSDITTVVKVDIGAFTTLWDIQMLSPVYGFAGWGAIHQGRLYQCAHPTARRSFAASQPGALLNYDDGIDDGDAFVETISSDVGGDLIYIASSEDLIFLTTRGCSYQPTRGGEVITATNIGPVRFSSIGAARIPPIPVDDGVVFIDSVGQQVYAAVLTGQVNRSWTAENISDLHSHQIRSPVHIGATIWGSEYPEQFIYITNNDGTAAVCQWSRSEERISWRPWVTQGSFKAIYQAAGKVHAVVERTLNGVTSSFRERFERNIHVDCSGALYVEPASPGGVGGELFYGGVTRFPDHLVGVEAQVYLEGWDYGDILIDEEGAPILGNVKLSFSTTYTGIAQIGLGFTPQVIPWARRSARTFTGVRSVKRIVDLSVTVQATGQFRINGADFAVYGAGADFTQPPAKITREVRIALMGGGAFDRAVIDQPRPGPFRILEIKQRVTV